MPAILCLVGMGRKAKAQDPEPEPVAAHAE